LGMDALSDVGKARAQALEARATSGSTILTI
jgi:hypothetical protein